MVSKNDIYDVNVSSYGSEGEGICKIDGYTIFVPGAAAGDLARIKVVKALKNYGYGKLIKVISPSADRCVPACPVAGMCGGCSIMHLDYDAQLRYKQQKVLDSMKRIGGINVAVDETVASPLQAEYRNKVSLPVSTENEKIAVGFYALGSHRVVESDCCILQMPFCKEIENTVISYMENNGVSPYSEETCKGSIRHIFIRNGFHSGEIMVVIVSARKELPNEKELASALAANINVKSVIINYNPKKTNVILGNHSRLLYGRDFIYDSISGLNFKINHRSFYQINTPVTELLYNKVLELMGDCTEKTVFDIYCGIGTISLFAASLAKKVIGVEFIPEAVDNARENAKDNNIGNAEFYAGDAAEVIKKLYEDGFSADIVILDPPRKGCIDILDTVVNINPEKIIYVSCNPATLARDAKVLELNGYRIISVTPYDMFPHTSHVETVVLITRVKE